MLFWKQNKEDVENIMKKEMSFHISDYGKKPTFASFLPGISGIRGIPIWCYYVNRGQGVVSFGVENKAEVHVFLKISCFSDDPTDVGNLICGSSAFSEFSLTIWKFMVHIVLKPALKNFEHYFASV